MRRKAQNIRTIVLALAATACFVFVAIFSFDVDPEIMWDYFLGSVTMFSLVLLAAFVFLLLWKLIKRSVGAASNQSSKGKNSNP